MNITNINAKETKFVTRTVINDNFVKELSKIPLLTAQEEKELFTRLKESKKRVAKALGTSEYIKIKEEEEKIQLSIRNEVITRNQRLNYAAAKRYHNNDIVMELVNVGAIGMIEAFNEYDIDKGVRFCTYAMYYIRRAINAFLTKENIFIRSSNDSKILPKVKKIENEFLMKEGRTPSYDEIQEILFKQYNIVNIDNLDLNMAEVSYIDAPAICDEDRSVAMLDEDYNNKTAAYNDYEIDVEMDSKRKFINTILNTLSEREKTIIMMAMGYGYDREYKDSEIAEYVNMTSERVRQIKIAALKKLQKFAAVSY